MDSGAYLRAGAVLAAPSLPLFFRLRRAVGKIPKHEACLPRHRYLFW
jgi:hypothetical protein